MRDVEQQEIASLIAENVRLARENARLTDENAALRERIATAIEAEAEVDRTSYNGCHPAIQAMTHAAAMRFAAEIARTTP